MNANHLNFQFGNTWQRSFILSAAYWVFLTLAESLFIQTVWLELSSLFFGCSVVVASTAHANNQVLLLLIALK